jgi:hypothetical protein
MRLPLPDPQRDTEAGLLSGFLDLAHNTVAVPQRLREGRAAVADREDEQLVPVAQPGIEFSQSAQTRQMRISAPHQGVSFPEGLF